MGSPDTAGGRCRATPPRWPLAALAISLLGALAFTSTTPAAPLEVYGRLPRLEDVALSPDGTHIAFVKTEGNTRVVAVMSVADLSMLRGVRVTDTKLRGIRWADNDHLLILISVATVPRGFMGDTAEWFQLQVYDVRNGANYQIPEEADINKVDYLNVIVGRVMVRHLKNHTVLFFPGLQFSRELLHALIRVDLDARATTVMRVGRPGTLRWIVDDAGEI